MRLNSDCSAASTCPSHRLPCIGPRRRPCRSSTSDCSPPTSAVASNSRGSVEQLSQRACPVARPGFGGPKTTLRHPMGRSFRFGIRRYQGRPQPSPIIRSPDDLRSTTDQLVSSPSSVRHRPTGCLPFAATPLREPGTGQHNIYISTSVFCCSSSLKEKPEGRRGSEKLCRDVIEDPQLLPSLWIVMLNRSFIDGYGVRKKLKGLGPLLVDAGLILKDDRGEAWKE